MSLNKSLNTVILDVDKCKGCIACMKRCPTEAIRVRDGKATVNYDRCIGCGECVRLCPHQAKRAAYDNYDTIFNYRYRIALPAPSLYGQFNNLNDINIVLNSLLKLGFNDVYDVGRGAELVSAATSIAINDKNIVKPIISTACPAVVELVMLRFHNLKDNLLQLLAPVDVAAKLAREKAISKGISEEEIGVFFISPCPAKVYALKAGFGLDKPSVDGVLSMKELYMKLLPIMNSIDKDNLKSLSKFGGVGLGWASSGGEAEATYKNKYLAADGMENVMHILEAIENGMMNDIDFVELNACIGGCVGGVLTVENPFVAKARIRELKKKLPQSINSLADVGKGIKFYSWSQNIESNNAIKFDTDRRLAMTKLMAVENKLSQLPQLDCGLCGAPSCKAFSEDVINGVIDPESRCPRLKK